ncbi:MAG: hypothetical protein RLZZ142_1676 [Verrucomicrobiota bacterium]
MKIPPVLGWLAVWILGACAAARGAELRISTPLDYQVVQRSVRDSGEVWVEGEFADVATRASKVEYRAEVSGRFGGWMPVEGLREGREFRFRATFPAGGWYRLQLRAWAGDQIAAESEVAHFGVGEVFLVAGQSNAANYGTEKLRALTGLVSAFDGDRWSLSEDPQPGATGEGGSFLAPFGDAISKRFGVPVGLVPCGVGGSSVRQWLPKGSRSLFPPGKMKSTLPDGSYQSPGFLFSRMVSRMRSLGPRGVRAVLWHQGETDSSQQEQNQVLPGRVYREHLETVIRKSNEALGWETPWFVAQVSFLVNGYEACPDLRAAQASLWKDGVALEGPDTDQLKGAYRENGGESVHFTGAGLREHAARWVQKVEPWLEKQLQLDSARRR